MFLEKETYFDVYPVAIPTSRDTDFNSRDAGRYQLIRPGSANDPERLGAGRGFYAQLLQR